MAWREFRFVRDGKADLVWKIEQLGDSYHTQHGQLDGAMQEYSDTPGSKGMLGTKAHIDPVVNCQFHIDREIRKKTEAGYIEYKDGKLLENKINSVDFSKSLPKCFCTYKPQTSISDSVLAKLHNKKLARYTRKLDGQCHILAHHTTGWKIYSRRIDDTTERFLKLINYVNEHKQFGVGTILVGEVVCLKSDGTEDFRSVCRFCRSLPEESRKLVEDKEIHEPIFVVFDVLFHNGRDNRNKSYDDRSKLLKTLVPLGKIIDFELAAQPNPFFMNECLLASVDYYDLTPDTWEATAKHNKWEGFVVTDGSAVPGDKFYSFNGKANRPKGTYKLKPESTEDCVVCAVSEGSGKRLGKVGALWLKQIDPDTDQFRNFGKVGSGLTEEDVEYFTKKASELNIPFIKTEKELKDLDKNYGLVVEVKYNERQEDTGKFRFPVFLRTRTDKVEDECIANL